MYYIWIERNRGKGSEEIWKDGDSRLDNKKKRSKFGEGLEGKHRQVIRNRSILYFKLERFGKNIHFSFFFLSFSFK